MPKGDSRSFGAILGAHLPRLSAKTAGLALVGCALLLAPTLGHADDAVPPPPQEPGLEAVPIIPIEHVMQGVADLAKSVQEGTTTVADVVDAIPATKVAGKAVQMAAEHTKNKRKSTHNKHTKPRAGRSGTKNRQQDGWVQNPNKRPQE